MRKQARLGDMRGALGRTARFVVARRVANAAGGGHRESASETDAPMLG